jgi:hypothetical protein
MTVSQLLALLLTVLLPLGGLIAPPPAVAAAATDAEDSQHYLCEGDLLMAEVQRGAVDARDIPNSANGTVPANDPDHPDFAQRRGQWEDYSCEPARP